MIGFAAETENVAANAKAKLARKGCDWILANDVSPQTGIMGGDRNTIELVTAEGVEAWPPQTQGRGGRHADRAHRRRAREIVIARLTHRLNCRRTVLDFNRTS